MTQIYYYSTPPSPPSDPGWTVDLGDQIVRLGSIAGLVTNAEMGSPGISSIIFDDLTGTIGHDGDDITGLKYFHVVETDCPSGDQYLGVWFTGSRTYRRGSGNSLITGPMRQIEVELVDSNFVLTWHIIRAGDADRPAETADERLDWLLGTTWVSARIIPGVIDVPDLVNMDAVDYTGQRVVDVIDDCAQQTSSNYYLYFSEADGSFALAFGPDVHWDYAGFNLTNDLATFNSGPTTVPVDQTWLMPWDIELVRNPDRVHTAVYVVYANGAEYVEDLGTELIRVDATAPVSNVKTSAKAIALGNRYLDSSEEEADRISCTVQVPSSGVTQIKAGMATYVDFTHLPQLVGPDPDFFGPGQGWCTIVSCSQAQDEENNEFYNVHLELIPYDSGEVVPPS